jgi:transposase-like protein
MSFNGGEELRLLGEIARWTREAALPIVRERVERALDSDPKKRVYEAMADGTDSVAAIEKSTGVNHNDIRKWVAEWEGERIAEIDGKSPKAMFTLRELGIAPAPPRTPRRRGSAS